MTSPFLPDNHKGRWILFSAPLCSTCQNVRAALEKRGIDFIEFECPNGRVPDQGWDLNLIVLANAGLAAQNRLFPVLYDPERNLKNPPTYGLTS